MEGDYKTVSCSLCDLLLESKPNPDAHHGAGEIIDLATPAGAQPAIQNRPAGREVPTQMPAMLQTVIAAEDTEGILRQLTKTLTERSIAKSVLPALNGEECLIQYHRAVAAGNIPQLLILDVNMPILNGINAAIAVRAAERASGTTTPTPILFFTSTACDDSFKRVLQFTAPARYLNKGAPGSPQEFAERLVQVLIRLLNPAAAGAPLP